MVSTDISNLAESNLVKSLLSHELIHQPDILATQILQKLQSSTISNPALLIQQLLNFDSSDQQELQSIIQEAEWSFIEVVAAYLHNQRVVAFDNEAASSNKQNVHRVLTQQHASCLQELEDILESESQAQKNRGVMRNLQKQKQQQQMQEQIKTVGNQQTPKDNISLPNQDMDNPSNMMNTTNLYNSIMENLYLQQQLQKTQQQNEFLQQQYSGSLNLSDQSTSKLRSSFEQANSGLQKSFDQQGNQMFENTSKNLPQQRSNNFMNQQSALPNIKTGSRDMGSNNAQNNPYAQARLSHQFANLNFLNQSNNNPNNIIENLAKQETPANSSKSHSFDNPYVPNSLKPTSPNERTGKSFDDYMKQKQGQNYFQNLLSNYHRGSLDSGNFNNQNPYNYNKNNPGGNSLQDFINQQKLFEASNLMNQQQIQSDLLGGLDQNRIQMMYQNQLLNQMQSGQNQGKNNVNFNQVDMQQMLNQQQAQNDYLQQMQRNQGNKQPNVNRAYMSSFYNPTNYGNQNNL